MSAAFSIGISLMAETSATKATLTQKVDTKTYMAHDGSFGGAATFDPTFDFSAEGVGTNPYGFDAPPSFPNSSGTVFVESYGTSAKNDDFQTWKVSGKIFPGA